MLSCFRRRFALNDPNLQLLSLEGAAKFYDNVMRLSEIYRAKIPLDLREVRHEVLVADFDSETRRICGDIGIPWTSGLKGFAETATRRAVITPTADQLASGLNTRGVGYWRNYRAELVRQEADWQPTPAYLRIRRLMERNPAEPVEES